MAERLLDRPTQQRFSYPDVRFTRRTFGIYLAAATGGFLNSNLDNPTVTKVVKAVKTFGGDTFHHPSHIAAFPDDIKLAMDYFKDGDTRFEDGFSPVRDFDYDALYSNYREHSLEFPHLLQKDESLIGSYESDGDNAVIMRIKGPQCGEPRIRLFKYETETEVGKESEKRKLKKELWIPFIQAPGVDTVDVYLGTAPRGKRTFRIREEHVYDELFPNSPVFHNMDGIHSITAFTRTADNEEVLSAPHAELVRYDVVDNPFRDPPLRMKEYYLRNGEIIKKKIEAVHGSEQNGLPFRDRDAEFGGTYDQDAELEEIFIPGKTPVIFYRGAFHHKHEFHGKTLDEQIILENVFLTQDNISNETKHVSGGPFVSLLPLRAEHDETAINHALEVLSILFLIKQGRLDQNDPLAKKYLDKFQGYYFPRKDQRIATKTSGTIVDFSAVNKAPEKPAV